MWNHTVREGETVTLTCNGELGDGQEVWAGTTGTVRYVFDDSVSVRFEMTSDITGAEYVDYLSIPIDELGEWLEEFEWIED